MKKTRRRRHILFLAFLAPPFLLGLVCLVNWMENERPLAFQSPIYSSGPVPIRNDEMGEGAFGARRGSGKHLGLDIAGPVGTPVLATESGRVIETGHHKNLGKYVEISHRKGFISIYGHLSRIDAEVGKKVRRGEVIGAVGQTGNANYPEMIPHVHFEMRNEDYVPVDPLPLIERHSPL